MHQEDGFVSSCLIQRKKEIDEKKERKKERKKGGNKNEIPFFVNSVRVALYVRIWYNCEFLKTFKMERIRIFDKSESMDQDRKSCSPHSSIHFTDSFASFHLRCSEKCR
jgi:hypothetical protein